MRKLLALVATLAGLAGMPAMAETVDVETAQGVVTLAQVPQTIAVFDIAAIDTIAALGVPIAGIPDRLYVPELDALADEATVVGTLFEPDLEALSALAPDLVIVGGRSSPALVSVGQVAPAIDMTLTGDDLLQEARQRIAAYGDLFGREEQAATLTARLDAAVEKARAAVAGKGRALIVMTNGPRITVYGAGSRFGWLHTELGLEAAVAGVDASQHGEAVSFEFVREADPDWLVVVDRAAAIGSGELAAQATLDNDLVAGTSAWRTGQIVYLPPADFYIAAGGAEATLRVLEALAEGFGGTP